MKWKRSEMNLFSHQKYIFKGELVYSSYYKWLLTVKMQAKWTESMLKFCKAEEVDIGSLQHLRPSSSWQ